MRRSTSGSSHGLRSTDEDESQGMTLQAVERASGLPCRHSWRHLRDAHSEPET
jgi:hypothetical protein